MKRTTACALMMLAWSGAALAATPVRPPIASVSHLAVYAADPAKSEAFYVHDLGGVKGPDPENPQGARYYFSPVQFVEVLPLPPGPPSINRLDHVAFNTPDVEAMRAYLAAKGVAVPAQVETGADGGRWFDVVDPEGTKLQFVQAPAAPPAIPVNALSSHVMHVGFIAHDRTRLDRFWRDVLGFRPYWAGGMKDDVPTWISLQTPDGTDWLEYMIVGTPDGRGIPAGMSQATLGIFNHVSLGVPDTRAAYTRLWNGDRLAGQDGLPKIGRDAKWQLNLIDPDGTRVELMELHAIGKPCCTPFTGKDPEN
jgi:catechol 2,3-dioxygenase-like lactoylglutathione lyase family enzyme/predicted enzyme related to lactoylglutathione lyase